ncbi:Lrp/AsnC family transcriptional regulator [bacterium]|nr:MAG: Lrp/AsnC family transcriptional regulator [bacterium]|tara:strand:+ start:7365 stop:7838 length:474 start_codon:yes stop_codon:yes gene_type:complete
MKENKSSISLDSIDKKIISLLKSNARNSVSKISDLVGLSIPATSDRIKKLEELEIIKGYKAVINSRKIGIDLRALITIISESSSNYEKIINFVNETDEVVECFATTGRGSHILIVETQNTGSLEKLLRTIQSWPNVIRTETQIILSENKIFTQINNK